MTNLNENQIRQMIVDLALPEVGKVIASQADPVYPTKRYGSDRLLEYFHTAAPGFCSDAVITNLGSITDWCGIFALWAIKTGLAPGADKPLGTWKKGYGISSVLGMVPTSSPQKGDVAAKTLYLTDQAGNYIKDKDGNFIKNGAHMDLVYNVYSVGDPGKDIQMIQTIDGNDFNGTVTGPSTGRSKTSFTSGFYTAFSRLWGHGM